MQNVLSALGSTTAKGIRRFLFVAIAGLALTSSPATLARPAGKARSAASAKAKVAKKGRQTRAHDAVTVETDGAVMDLHVAPASTGTRITGTSISTMSDAPTNAASTGGRSTFPGHNRAEKPSTLPPLLRPSFTSLDPMLVVSDLLTHGMPVSDDVHVNLVANGRLGLVAGVGDAHVGVSTPLYGEGGIFVLGAKF